MFFAPLMKKVIVYVSAACKKTLGYLPQELVGKPYMH
jgi:hypothetical protein